MSEIGDGINGLAALEVLGEMIEPAKDHLHGQGGKGLLHGVGRIIRQVDQDGIQQPTGPDLGLDAVERTDPQVGQAQQPLDHQEDFFNPPALAVERHDLLGRQDGRVEHVGQVAVPAAMREHFDQAHQLFRLFF